MYTTNVAKASKRWIVVNKDDVHMNDAWKSEKEQMKMKRIMTENKNRITIFTKQKRVQRRELKIQHKYRQYRRLPSCYV